MGGIFMSGILVGILGTLIIVFILQKRKREIIDNQEDYYSLEPLFTDGSICENGEINLEGIENGNETE